MFLSASRIKRQILKDNGVDSSTRPFVLTAKGLDPSLLPALRIQRATESELKTATDGLWGESLGARVRAKRTVHRVERLSTPPIKS